MTSSNNRNIGIGLLAVAAVVIFVILLWPAIARAVGIATPPPPPTPTPTPVPAVQGIYVSGGYRFNDEEILAYLRDQYGLEVTFVRKGTFDMSDEWTEDVDCIWPSSRTGIEYFETSHPGVIRRAETIFQDPVVVFSWEEYLPAFEAAGMVETVDGVHILRMQPLLGPMLSDQRWEDVGVNIPGYVNIESTDPLTSASGLMWYSLVAGYLVPGNEDGARVVSLGDLEEHDLLPVLYEYWENQGLQVDTTGKLFPRFVLTHAPLIVAYESNYTDFYQSLEPEEQEAARQIIGLYPEVTINTEHTLASTSEACDPLLEAFVSDPRLEEMGWRLAGVRNNEGGIGERPGNAPWIAANVPYVSEPRLDATNAIKAALGGE